MRLPWLESMQARIRVGVGFKGEKTMKHVSATAFHKPLQQIAHTSKTTKMRAMLSRLIDRRILFILIFALSHNIFAQVTGQIPGWQGSGSTTLNQIYPTPEGACYSSIPTELWWYNVHIQCPGTKITFVSAYVSVSAVGGDRKSVV